MEMHHRVSGQPPVVLGLVDAEVVQNHVQFGVGIPDHDPVHKVQELPSAPAAIVTYLHHARVNFQGSKKGDGAMSLIFVSVATERLPIGKTQPPLSPLQGLDGRLLIYADHHGFLRRVQIQSYDVCGLLGKLRVAVLTHQLRRRCRWIPCLRSTRQTWSAETSPRLLASKLPVHVV